MLPLLLAVHPSTHLTDPNLRVGLVPLLLTMLHVLLVPLYGDGHTPRLTTHIQAGVTSYSTPRHPTPWTCTPHGREKRIILTKLALIGDETTDAILTPAAAFSTLCTAAAPPAVSAYVAAAAAAATATLTATAGCGATATFIAAATATAMTAEPEGAALMWC
jgi:hypothetical protein